MNEKKYDDLMEKAREINKKRDKDDEQMLYAAPSNNEVWKHLRVAYEAIKSGMITDDWQAIAEAQAMIEQIIPNIALIEEAHLKRIELLAGGCATYTTTLYELLRQFDTIGSYTLDDLPKLIELGKERPDWILEYIEYGEDDDS